jgi:hypothetical protein
MAGFKAEGVVEALDYDLKPYVNASGTIPEPTDDQIAAFLTGMKAVFKEAEQDLPQDLDVDDPGQLLGAIDSLDPEVQIRAMNKMSGVYAALCSDTPTADQISQLPLRVRTIFFNWLQNEVMNPEAVTGGGTAQVSTLRTARAG